MDTEPKISLIFVNYHSAKLLEKALESLYSYEKEKALFEVIVVNNDISETREIQVLKVKFAFIGVENETNAGFGQGANVGARLAHGDILGFINPDVLWTKECLPMIEKVWKEKRTLGVLGMHILDVQNKEEAWSAGKEPTLFGLFWRNIVPFWCEQQRGKKTALFDWVSGCALFVRKDTFLDLGGFDEQFFLYFEDVDLCRRVREIGLAVVRDKHLPIIHHGGQSKQSTMLQKEQFYSSQKKYFEKWRPRWESKMLGRLHSLFRKNSV